MIDSIKNDVIEIKVKRLGAELTSIKNIACGLEYLWQGDRQYWGGQSYNLFPIIGGLPGNQYILDGETYCMKPHGFARNSEFELFSREEHRLVYRLSHSEDTLAVYPFEFEFFVIYELMGNSLSHRYQVNNLSSQEMLFSVGAHPGFRCPLFPGETMEDYYLRFETEEIAHKRLKADGLLTGERKLFLDHQRELRLAHHLFYEGAAILDEIRSHWLEIRSSKNRHGIRVAFEGFRYLGLWSAQNDGPFVCIEPWFGVDSTAGDSPEFTQKEGLEKLPPKESFMCGYTMAFVFE